MFSNLESFSASNKHEWFTISEAASLLSELTGLKTRDYDIYRYAIFGRINLSIYFQSPVFLRKIKSLNHKIKFTPTRNTLADRLCMLDTGCFLNGRNLVMSTEGHFLTSTRQVLDTTLIGHEYVQLQCLLARALRLPRPICNVNTINYGTTVISSGEIFQLFENITWQEKIKKQLMKLPAHIQPVVRERLSAPKIYNDYRKGYFPHHHLPPDACFVVRHSELEKLVNACIGERKTPPPTSRISSPLARLLWLACRNNDTIRPLIGKPYKLVSIFEQWALNEGMTDKLSADTLKAALERGSPPPVRTDKH